MSDPALGTVAPGEPEVRARSAEPRSIWFWPLLPIGIAAIFVGTMVLNDVTAEIRVTLVLLGIVGGYFGLDAICQRRWGSGFDTSAWLSGFWLTLIGLSAITVAGITLGRLIGGTVIIETIFGLEGLGKLIVGTGVIPKNYTIVQGGVLVLAVGYVLLNALIDISYQYLDPRIRRGRV